MVTSLLLTLLLAQEPATPAAPATPQAPTAPAAAETSPSNEIETLEISGNGSIRPETIRNYMRTMPGDTLNPETIARDVTTLYALGWFDDIDVVWEPGAQGGKILVFKFRVRPAVRSIGFTGLSTINQTDILAELRRKRVGLGIDKPLDISATRRAEAIIRGMLVARGKESATVEYDVEPLGQAVPPNTVALTFNVNEGPAIAIEKIRIEGLQTLSEHEIKGAMKLLQETGAFSMFNHKDRYSSLKLQDDLTRIRMLLTDRGYARAAVLNPVIELKPTPVARTPWGIPLPFRKKIVERYYLTIPIEENDRYRIGAINIKGATILTTDEIKRILGIKPGDLFNESLLRKGMENLKQAYGEKGHINFSPNPQNELDDVHKVVNITIDIEEGAPFVVHRITFIGNSTTRDKVIRREFALIEGRPFNSRDLDNSLRRLNQLGYFGEIRETDAELKFNRLSNEVDVDVKLKEHGKNSIGVSGGVSGIGGSFVGMTYRTENFLGRGNAVTVDIQGGARESTFVLSYTEPYVMDRPLLLGMSIYGHRSRYEQSRAILGLNNANLPAGLGFDNPLNYQQDRRGFNVSGGYRLPGSKMLSLQYQFEQADTREVNPATEEYFRVATDSFGVYHSRKLTPSLIWRTASPAAFPIHGHALSLAFDYTGGLLGGNVNLIRPTAQFEFYRPHTKHRNVLAFRFQSSYITGFSNVAVPFYERLFAGGDYDIRGFPFRKLSPISFITRYLDTTDAETGVVIKKPVDDTVQVGGDSLAIANLEYRIPLNHFLTLSPFVDAGNTWALRKSPLLREFRNAAGNLETEAAKFLPGTNSGIRMSAGVELQVLVPYLNAPIRFIWALNPLALNKTYTGPAAGTPFQITQPRHEFKFSMGRTF